MNNRTQIQINIKGRELAVFAMCVAHGYTYFGETNLQKLVAEYENFHHLILYSDNKSFGGNHHYNGIGRLITSLDELHVFISHVPFKPITIEFKEGQKGYIRENGDLDIGSLTLTRESLVKAAEIVKNLPKTS